ncbi:MAG TPA: glycosyltransferase family 39 protein [Rudaea sp.]|nr:glycosyltransferase family 39 protein [Rudaea sp.]
MNRRPDSDATDNKATVSALHRRHIAFVLLAILGVKLTILLIDPNPRFFLWDSVTYLRGAIDGSLPRDRSFLYSLLIGAIAVPLHSLHALVIAQSLAGVASAFFVYLIVRVFLHARFEVALIAALLVALEPGQLFYERMVMAEAFGSAIWLGFLVLVLAYVRDGRTIWLPAIALAGIAAIGFRLNGTAVVLLVAPCLPLWRAWFTNSGPRTAAERSMHRRRVALQLAVSVAMTLVLHVGYRHIVAEIAHTRPGYIGTEGLFLLGFTAPAVIAADFDGTDCDPTVLRHVHAALDDPRMREGQLWGDGGLWAAMQRDCPRPEAAADVVASRASHRIFGKVLPMALTTTAQYFDDAEATWRMNSDLGRKGMLPLELIEPAEQYFSLDVKPIAFTDTLTLLWFQHARWWFTACFLLAPLLAAGMAVRLRRDACAPEARLLALVVFGLFFSQFLLSPIIAFRYLHPFPPLMFVCAAAILARYFAGPGSLAHSFHEIPGLAQVPLGGSRAA